MLKMGKELEYDLSKTYFDVYVPGDYDGSVAYGLVVWVSPGGGGTVPDEGWRGVLDRRKLIWVGPALAGNDAVWPVRVGKALDAVANIKSLYRIDDTRVYATGLSGGGRAASMLGIGFPDVFAGGCYIAGCDSLPGCGVRAAGPVLAAQPSRRPKPSSSWPRPAPGTCL